MMVLNTDSLDVLTVFKVGTLTAALGIMLNSMSVVLGLYLAFLVPCWLSLMAYIFGANGFLAPQDAMICGVAVTIFGLVLIGSSASMARLTRMFSLRKFELDEALTETRETHARETALSHKLAEQARRDALTGAYNRRYLGEQLEYHIANFVRNRQPFSVVLIDIDHFKTINDTYGHDVGDKVLTVVNLAMSQALREVDILGRWGRDEFLCVLPQTSRAEAIRCAERLRQCLKQADFALGDTVLRVTASFGVATSEKGDGVGNLIKHCDLALYRAKSEGRDRVAAHPWGSDAT